MLDAEAGSTVLKEQTTMDRHAVARSLSYSPTSFEKSELTERASVDIS
ncbi:hypothetical protein [Bradyrhizobium sp. AS23.2]|nr:hypothetical protein [Bradyrhizobium sp. AS23.2]